MKIAFDIKLMRPGCVLLQAARGCNISVASKFPAETWLIAPTPDLHVYEITEEQLVKLVDKVKFRNQGGSHGA